MKRILVTGGAGFIGSHLCSTLLSLGNQVICMDNLFSGDKRNINHLLNDTNFEFIRWDVTQPYSVEVDQIYNLACPASPVHYQKDPVQTIRTNVMGTINALDLARRLNIPILQASTSEVYGSPTEHPQPEWYWGNVNPVGLRSCYDEGKRCAETLCMDYHRQYGTPVKIARIFNTYGPRMRKDDGRVISNFIVQALKGLPLTIYGDGSQTRSFQFVDDLIEAFIRFMQQPDFFTGPLNLGNPGEFTMKELAETIIRLTGVKAMVVYKDLPSDDPLQRCPNIELAKAVLDWEPQVTLETGLKLTIAYFKALLTKDKEL